MRVYGGGGVGVLVKVFKKQKQKVVFVWYLEWDGDGGPHKKKKTWDHFDICQGGICPPWWTFGGQMYFHDKFYRGANIRGGLCPTLVQLD